MKRFSFLYILLIISILSQSCRKDIDDIVKTPPDIPVVVKVVSSVHGTVMDGFGNPVAEALVNLDGESTITDENGIFQFIDKKMNKNGTYISVEKAGFFNGSRRFYPSSDNTSIAHIELIPLDYIGDFNSENGATITQNGLVLDFPEDAIVYKDGSIFSGTVNVAAAYLDPTDPSALDQMPGDLTGISTEDGLVALKSLGMITVELIDNDGKELQVKSGSQVEVEIPIPNDLQSTAPLTIPMWHFNEDVGIWEEEGYADLVGDHYETSLSHFSFWNCDIPNDYISLKGSIENRSIPVQGVTVMIYDTDNNTSGYGVTDENGMFSGLIPNDSELVMTIFDNCGNELYVESLTTGSEDIELDPINLVVQENNTTVTGTISFCNTDFSEYAYVRVQNGIDAATFPIAADGSFTGNIFYCNIGDPIIVSGYDPINGLVSGAYFFEIEGDINVGNIEICDEGYTEHIIIEYGDVKWNLLFDDKLVNIFNIVTDIISEGDEGYILRSIYEPVDDSIHIFKLDVAFEEGSPIQGCRLEYINDFDKTGNSASGTYSGQIVTYDGIEYFHATGVLTEAHPWNPLELQNEPMYFDILIENIN